MVKLIDGKTIAAQVKDDIKHRVASFVNQGKRQPGLAVVLVGDDPASKIYVGNKQRSCEAVGMLSKAFILPDETTENDLIDLVKKLNQDDEIDGILVQLPLPEHIDADKVLDHIVPNKDVDGFHPDNIGRLALRRPNIHSCTPVGIMRLLKETNIELRGKHAVIVGASNIVGRPMALEMLIVGCTVTICHRFTQDLKSIVEQADIVVAAAGKPGLVKGEWIKQNACVIDVGINRMEDGTISGDVEFESAVERAAWITPVPGGVGPMTVAMLLENTLKVYEAGIVAR